MNERVGQIGRRAHRANPKQFNARMGPAMEQINPVLADADQISIERCRELLGEEAIGLRDDEVDRIRRCAETWRMS